MRNRKAYVIISFVLSAIFSFQIYYMVPEKVLLLEGESYDFPPMVKTAASDKGTQLRLFGVVPLRTVEVNILQSTELIPCGNAIGIKINIDGVMVVGTSEVQSSDGKKYQPAVSSRIKEGDIIEKVNEEKVSDIDTLSKLLKKSDGNPVNLTVKRNEQMLSLSITPVVSKDDGSYKIGAWVRDSSSGIGTLTFVNPKNNSFGALGHGITDIDTGKIIPAQNGEVLHSDIIGIKKGERGAPGELRGTFSGSGAIGNVNENCESGIFGTINGTISGNKAIPIATRSQIKCGDAYILSNIESDKVEKYSIQVQRVMKNSVNNKSMILKITDERLLRKTGGIVQGMSGSPIIQDGKLIGAVTHVFINDPTRGYGTFIETMLNNTIID